MVLVGSYLMTGQTKTATPPTPSDGAGPVLDSIDAAGPNGADIPFICQLTGYDADFAESVLRDLEKNGMTATGSDMRYRLTDLGSKARYIVAR